jgi:hypothetical protein
MSSNDDARERNELELRARLSGLFLVKILFERPVDERLQLHPQTYILMESDDLGIAHPEYIGLTAEEVIKACENHDFVKKYEEERLAEEASSSQ